MPRPAPVLLDREQAILEFNRRVLAQAERADVPLLERLRYVCIVSSNLDEFFEVRFSDLLDSVRDKARAGVAQDIERVGAAAHALIDEQYAVFNDQLMPALAQRGIHIRHHAARNAAQRAWVSRFFDREVRPLLVPVSLDPAHPFPQAANKALHFIVKLAGDDALGRANPIAIVRVPRVLPRVIKLPAQVAPGEQAFVLLTSVIRAHLGELFPGREVVSFSQFRVTRDSDIDVDEEEVANLRHAMRSRLSTRHFGRAVRLEVVHTCPEDLAQLLLTQFQLPPAALYRVNGPVNLVRLNELIDQVEAPALRFAPHEPAWPQGRLPRGKSIFQRLRDRDVLLHHPFESFEPVIELLREAVNDPEVLAIKQTVYRTGARSELMELLLEAARRGKEVLVVVELKARFDEEANVNWAEKLEAAGAQVVYGIVGLKTHAKLLLVTRRETRKGGRILRRYLHLGTGNYNPRTARLYTDLGLLTADPALTADADAVFGLLASTAHMRRLHQLVLAPFAMQSRWLAELERVRQAALAGRRARVVVKVNALTDLVLIDALLACGQAGAEVDLIVRGACRLAPGIPGVSDKVRVRSVVGRFLEHTRVLYFAWGESERDEALYLSSADWMSRNMLGRIELAWPVNDPKMRQRVLDEALVPYLLDGRDAWVLDAAGGYQRVGTDGPCAQAALAELYRVD
ncbi:polyphosphate kinase 1 [Inhella crocodyli]|uniref:Polyphosphate kinase n=1 Tax=Inhella crocodyli TaxID=2499851 RepID=A0A3S2UAR4_9BURK|nr:polyphosphate kinase 1 [Inhella crocodyli]RVT83062.1 polyphosphate kinase 1 [Inhella crocodyli]